RFNQEIRLVTRSRARGCRVGPTGWGRQSRSPAPPFVVWLMPHFLVIVYADGADATRFEDELRRGGVLLARGRFWMIHARSREEALAWAARAPRDADVEVREVGDALVP